MRTRSLIFPFALCTVLGAQSLVDLSVNGEKTVTTAPMAGLPTALGTPSDPKVLFRLAPLQPGRRYEVTFTYDAGTDIGYSHAWIDGSPYGKDWHSFVGIGSGTGRQALMGKQEKFLFTVDSASTSRELYLALRSGAPFTVKVGLTERLSGVTNQSKDRWGFYYVTDLDADRSAPFKLTRGGGAAITPPPVLGGPWLPIAVNGDRQVTTAPVTAPLPTSFGATSDPKALFRLGPLSPGSRYQVTFTYQAGSDIGFAHAWVDGDPFGKSWQNLVGVGSGTGRQVLQGKEEVFLFTVHPASTSRYIYLVLRSTEKPLMMRVSLKAASNLSNQSKDRWGFFYVTDFDADRTAPFKLIR